MKSSQAGGNENVGFVVENHPVTSLLKKYLCFSSQSDYTLERLEGEMISLSQMLGAMKETSDKTWACKETTSFKHYRKLFFM